jgi:hypothetical protein
MRQHLCAGALALALIGSVGIAAAQRLTTPSQVTLSPPQADAIAKGLANQPNDTAPSGYQAQVGDKVPDSMTQHAMPGNLTAQVPATDKLRYSKLPDRILLVDPDNMMVVEIIPVTSSTTGSGDMGGRDSTSRPGGSGTIQGGNSGPSR